MTVATRARAFVRSVLPPPARRVLGAALGRLKIARAKRAFDACASGPVYLSASEIPRLMTNEFREPAAIRYDPEGLVLRAQEKIGQLEARLPLSACRTFLELGCWDAIVGRALVGRGASYGIDIRSEGFDGRARAAGVKLVQADVESIPFADSALDLVYSFAAFEHFPNPRGVVAESWRVLRAGGYLYLLFGPVYTAPYGRHAYRDVPIPYCHYLFREEDLKVFARRRGLRFGDWPYVNGVTVTEYRRLWAEYAGRFEIAYYTEHPAGGVGAELIARYPQCFKGKVASFDDLLVSAIEVCLRKQS